VLVASQIVANVQSIVSRNVNPLDNVVVSICAFNAGFTDNVIPQTATLLGTVRTLTPEMRDFVEARLHSIVEGTAALFGATAKLHY
ncbi:peptidase dimerization domain-containing protein, partial [Stenotrophomonas maltophilia]|uniref:peptidase dimerization domain-containing protein n=1 Tax=Stenotrophomonas maltophilia TaxID=40324 RepID=UPI0013D90FAB